MGAQPVRLLTSVVVDPNTKRGISRDERAALNGFQTAMLDALPGLRETWCFGDAAGRPVVVRALAWLQRPFGEDDASRSVFVRGLIGKLAWDAASRLVAEIAVERARLDSMPRAVAQADDGLNLDLSDLSGFQREATRALPALRDAWLAADVANKALVADAAALLYVTFADDLRRKVAFARVLTHKLPPATATALFEQVTAARPAAEWSAFLEPAPARPASCWLWHATETQGAVVLGLVWATAEPGRLGLELDVAGVPRRYHVESAGDSGWRLRLADVPAPPEL